jgi:hypothetical protein
VRRSRYCCTPRIYRRPTTRSWPRPHRAPLPPHLHPAAAAHGGALRGDVLLREAAAGQPLPEARVEAAGDRVLDGVVEGADLDVGVPGVSRVAVGPQAHDADVPAVERLGVGAQVEDGPGVLQQ